MGRKPGASAARKPRHWQIFGLVEIVGAAGGLGGLYWLQDPIGWGASLLVLLPGTLVAWPFSNLGRAGTDWPFWTVYVIAVSVNVLLFASVSFLVRLHRKPGAHPRGGLPPRGPRRVARKRAAG